MTWTCNLTYVKESEKSRNSKSVEHKSDMRSNNEWKPNKAPRVISQPDNLDFDQVSALLTF